MSSTVITVKPAELPKVRLRMESAPTLADAEKWAEKLGRPVYWIETNKSAYAPLEITDDIRPAQV